MQGSRFFARLLVPVDGSLPSMVAQELAVFIAKRFDSQVTVIHVSAQDIMIPAIQRTRGGEEVDAIYTSDGQFPRAVQFPKPRENNWPEEVVNEVSSWYVERGSRIIDEAVARFKDEGIPVERRLVETGDAADVILTEAEKGKYDLIIIGNSGEEERDQHLGSVAKKVAVNANVPVLITREKILISKILVPIDGSYKADGALAYAEALATKTGAKITLLYVQESTLFTLKPEVATEMGKHILDYAASKIATTQPEHKLESGDPAKKITEMARRENFDLIVMNSKGHGTVRRFLMGSVSDHVIHYADRSVLLTR
jgi:nucleotide-binding universal stress UspA family protein